LILFIGRLTAQKNPLAILEALAPMKNYRVHLIGEGDLRPALEARIQAEGLDHIRLLGNVPSQDLPQHLQAATLYLQPSLYEGHPKTIFEAMACGLPVLTSRVPGVQQFISHGETGYLCQTDPQSIREGVEILLADAPLRAHLGAAARSYVQQHLSLERVLALELEVLAETLAISPPPAQPRPRPWLASARTYGSRVWTVARRKLGGQ
jgi:glycosyltransferase involved in cell wall biosynthesis